MLEAVLISLHIDIFLCIFYTIPLSHGFFGEPFTAFEEDEEERRESIKILKEIHENKEALSESSDSDGVDELSRASIIEQEEKYGEPI